MLRTRGFCASRIYHSLLPLAIRQSGGFDLGYLGDGRRWNASVVTADDGSRQIVGYGDVSIPFPVDESYHAVEIALHAGSSRARITLDAEAVEPAPQPAISTNDPLEAADAYVRGELTDSVFFGLATGPEPGCLDLQLVEFELPTSDRVNDDQSWSVLATLPTSAPWCAPEASHRIAHPRTSEYSGWGTANGWRDSMAPGIDAPHGAW